MMDRITKEKDIKKVEVMHPKYRRRDKNNYLYYHKSFRIGHLTFLIQRRALLVSHLSHSSKGSAFLYMF
jgi:hypothetical protein